MTYFNLRKQQPERDTEDEQEPVEEEVDDTEDEPEEKTAPAAKQLPTSWPGAIWYGVSGPWAWLAAHFGDAGVTIAWIMHVGSMWAFFYYRGWVAAGLTVAWPLAVLAFIPREYLDRLVAWIERFDAGRHHARTDQLPTGTVSHHREALRGLLLNLVGDGRGVHLRSVLAHLQEHGQWEGRTVADLRLHLEALGIPVRPKVKVGGTPTRGVLRADLEALSPFEETSPSPAPSPPV